MTCPPLAVVHPADPAASDPLWSDVGSETLSSRICRQLRDELFADQLTPGTRLGTEGSLAKRFEVSRMAIRDAIRSLAAQGVLQVRVGLRGGVFIARGSPERLAETLAIQWKLIGANHEELLDAQIAVEVTAAGLAARNASLADIQRLKSEIDAMDAMIDAPDAFTRASLGFRESVVTASNNRVLIAQFRALRHVLTPIYTRHTTADVAQRALASHRALVACIEARDPDAASDLMRRRLEYVRARHLALEAVRPSDPLDSATNNGSQEETHGPEPVGRRSR